MLRLSRGRARTGFRSADLAFGGLRPALAFLLLLAAAGPARALPAGKWVRAKTEFVEVLSDASPKDAAEFAVQYSAFRFALVDLIGEPAKKLPPSTVLLFRNSRDFTRAFPSQDSRSEMVTVSTEIDGAALLGQSLGGDRVRALQLAFEFETTWGLQRMGYYLPLVVQQGTGKVFSTLEVRKGTGVLGRIDANAVNSWESRPIPWARFFAVTPASPEYADPNESYRCHAQAWALMHYVWLGGPDGHARFDRLAQALRLNRDDAAIEQAFGVTPKELTNKVSRHVDGGSHAREFRFDESGLRARMETGPVDPAVPGIYFADLLAANRRALEATRELEAARARAADLPLLREALAREARRNQEFEKAAALYRQAIELGTTNPSAYVITAQHALNQVSGGRGDESGGGGVFAENARNDLRRALELNPGSEEAWRTLGRALFMMPNVTPADVEELNRGVERCDTSGAVRFYRALLFERLGNAAASEADLRALATMPMASPGVKSQAGARLEIIVYKALVARVETLVAQRDFDAARELVNTRKPELGRQAEDRASRLLRWVDQAATASGTTR